MNPIDAISLSLSIFRSIPEKKIFARFLEQVREAGYEYVELSPFQRNCYPDILPELRKSGLKVWSVHGILGSGSFSESESIRNAEIENAFRWAEGLAAPCPLVEHYLNRFNAPENGIRFRHSIEQFYSKVSALGYILCIETAPYKPLENERYPNSVEIAEFVRSFRKEDLQMTLDINHSNLHEDLCKAIFNTRGLVKNIHVSDNHGKKEEHLPPGEGMIDFKSAFDALRANGYTGPCNLEFYFPDDPIPSVTKMRNIRIKMEELLFGNPTK